MPRDPFSAAAPPSKGRSRWTPQLLKAFADATDALGHSAAPAAVLEHMGPAAAGLTRDAVAAHLQKHRSGVLRSGSRKSLEGRRSLDHGTGAGLKSLRTRSVPNMTGPCRRSPRTQKTPKPAGLPHNGQQGQQGDGQGFGTPAAADEGDSNMVASRAAANGTSFGMDPAWRLPPAQPPAQWCLTTVAAGAPLNPARRTPAVAAHNWALPTGFPAAAVNAVAAQQASWPVLQGRCATVTTGAHGTLLQGASPAQQPSLQGGHATVLPMAAPQAAGAELQPCSSPGSGSASSTALADGSAHAAEAAAPAMAAAAAAAAMVEGPQPPCSPPDHQQQPAAADRTATHSPEGCGAAACGFGAAFDAAADTSFELLGGLSASDDSDTELWSMAELTAAALSIPPEVLAEADLPPLLPDLANDSATSTPFSGGALKPAAAGDPAASGAWGMGFGTTAPLPQPASPVSYAPFGAPPPPFRGASGTFGFASTFRTTGSFSAGPEIKLQGGVGPLLQGGPGRLACISAPAACMHSAAALDAVHYAARHAHMLQDLRGRPTQPPIGLKLDKESVLEELRAAAV